MSLQPGTRLGPYEIVAAIGAGEMGEVYRAKDTRLDRTVAIKVLPEHLADNPERANGSNVRRKRCRSSIIRIFARFTTSGARTVSISW